MYIRWKELEPWGKTQQISLKQLSWWQKLILKTTESHGKLGKDVEKLMGFEKKITGKGVQFPTVVQAKGSIKVLERLSKLFTVNVNLYHVTKFAI